MKSNKVIAIFVITLIFFIGVFARPSYRAYGGMDSYYFSNYVEGKSEDISQSPVIGAFIFSILPNNSFVIRIIMFMVAFGIVFGFGLVGEQYSKKYGWLAGIILLTGFFFHNIFIRLEDDIFGLLFVVIAWYLLSKYHRVIDEESTQKPMLILASLVCLAIAVFTWKFAIFFVFIFWLASKNHPFYMISSFGILFLYWRDLFTAIIPNMLVSESLPVLGFVSLGIMMVSYTKKFKVDHYKLALIVATILALINMKFIFILFPIVTINFVHGLETLPSKYQKYMLVAIGLIFCYLCIHNYKAMPSEAMSELVDEYAQYQGNAKHTSIGNDYNTFSNWSYGYYLIHKGIATENFGNPGKNNIMYKNNIILTYKNDQNIKDCNILFFNSAGIITKC